MKAMIMFGGSGICSMSSQAYAHRYDKFFPTPGEWSLQKVTCPVCTKSMNCQYLTLHMHEKHGHPMLQVAESCALCPSQTYRVDFPIQQVPTNCPVQDCPAHPSMNHGL
jgi:hypothetical protein